MAEQLYPVFEIPSMTEKEDSKGIYADEYFWPGALFDFSKGDFVRNGANQVVMVDGADEYLLWVGKCIRTQIGACASYPEFGIDLEGSLAEGTQEGIRASLEKTITEALLRNPRTERVHTIDIYFDGDSVEIFFIVQPKGLPAFDINLKVVQ